MSTTQSVSARQHSGARPLYGLASLLGAAVMRLVREVSRRHRIRRDLLHLQQIDDYLLDDIGLKGSELHEELNRRRNWGSRYY